MSNYTRLIQREPNSNALNIREDCLIYWAHYSWKWADLDCHQKCYFKPGSVIKMFETNLSVYDKDSFESVAKDHFEQYTPLIAWIIIQSVTGIVGNILTIAYYASRPKKRSTTVFITAIGVFDLFACLLINTTIGTLYVDIDHSKRYLCKGAYYINHVIVLSSAMILWSISLDRYRKICQPQRWQFSTKSAKLFVTCAFIVSSIMSARVFIISDIVSVNISWNYGNMSYIVGKYCTSSVEDNQQHVVLISHLIDGVTFIVILATFLFMYGKILKVLRHHRSQTKVIRSARRNPGPSVYFKADNDEPNVTVLDLDTLSFEGNITQKIRSNVLKTSQSITIRWDRSIEISSNSSSPRLRRVRPNKPEDNLLAKHSNKDIGDFEQGSLYRKAISERRFDRKIAIMLLAVTVGFVVCFTPYFAATFTLRSESRDYDLELSPAIQVALRMPFMNSVINPIIFYACDTKFRYFAKYCCKK
ncbi:DRD2-like protein [Mya arenaria]|uniref:DRD2-like protein n=1 Tax=Mya arenaria TaxID=6604 RepID=A0ABY7F853_MYAAR|nr:DRD2-like protein [Mya arenaria]